MCPINPDPRSSLLEYTKGCTWKCEHPRMLKHGSEHVLKNTTIATNLCVFYRQKNLKQSSRVVEMIEYSGLQCIAYF